MNGINIVVVRYQFILLFQMPYLGTYHSASMVGERGNKKTKTREIYKRIPYPGRLFPPFVSLETVHHEQRPL